MVRDRGWIVILSSIPATGSTDLTWVETEPAIIDHYLKKTKDYISTGLQGNENYLMLYIKEKKVWNFLKITSIDRWLIKSGNNHDWNAISVFSDGEISPNANWLRFFHLKNWEINFQIIPLQNPISTLFILWLSRKRNVLWNFAHSYKKESHFRDCGLNEKEILCVACFLELLLSQALFS